MPAVERSVEIQASPRTVWELLASPEGWRAWFQSDVEIDLRVGGKHRHYLAEYDQWISGYVLEIQPEREMVLSWFEEDSDWVFPTRLTFTLEAIPGGTRVTQRYDGFAGIGKPTWEKTVQDYNMGIDAYNLLAKIKAIAERHHAAR